MALSLGGNSVPNTVAVSSSSVLTVTFTSALSTTGALTATVTSFGLSSGSPATTVATVRNPPTVVTSSATLSTAATSLQISGTGFDTSSPSSTTVALSLGGNNVPNTVAVSSSSVLTVTFSSALPTTGSMTAVVTSFGLSSGSAVVVATVATAGTVFVPNYYGNSITSCDTVGGSITTCQAPSAPQGGWNLNNPNGIAVANGVA